MRTSRKILSLAVVLLTIVACITFAAISFTPYGSKSQLIWNEFRQQENLDTICVGSSLAARSFDPAAIDETYGTNSFNLSTPGQQPAESYLGIKEAIEHHPIKRVVYGIDFATFQDYSKLYPGRVFLNEKWKGDPFFERFGDLSYALDDTGWMFKDKSINWLFPWVEQHVQKGFRGLMKNVRMQIDGTTLPDAAEANEKGWDYIAKGYGNYEDVVNYNQGRPTVFSDRYKPRELDEDSLRRLDEIIELCNENDIEFIAMVPPMPEYSLISLKKYYNEDSEQLKAFVEERGGSYYDLNLARPELFKPNENYYADFQHCNFAGATAASEALCKLMKMHEAGENTDSLFYTLDERLADIDHISIVRFSEKKVDGDVKLTAEPFAGSNVEIEYRYLIQDPETEEFELARDWSTDPVYQFTPEEKTRHLVRLEARVVGSSSEFDRFSEHKVWF